MRLLGWDLTDPFSRVPRPVDVADVDAPLTVATRGWLREGRILDVRRLPPD